MGKIIKGLGIVCVISILYMLLKMVIKPIPEEMGIKIIIVALLSIIAYGFIKVIKYIRVCNFVKKYNERVDIFGEVMNNICAEKGMFSAQTIIQDEFQNAEFQQLLEFLWMNWKRSVNKERYLTDFLFAMAEEGMVSKVLSGENRQGDILFQSTHPVENPTGIMSSIELNFD